VVGALTLVVALAAGATFAYTEYRFSQIHRVSLKHLAPLGVSVQGASPVSTPNTLPGPSAPFNVLLVGSDSRAFVDSSAQANSFGSASAVSGQRSDVIIIARVVPATHSVTLLSIPRDLWVDIPANSSGVAGYSKINAAFNSGPDLLVQTIQTQLGIPINHYAEINFAGFSAMVNAVGGLTLNFSLPVKDAYSGLNVTQTGCQAVNGTEALALVRSRHLQYEQNGVWAYDGLSDFSRIQRQDVFFRALLSKVQGTGTNPLALNDLLGAVVPNLTLDSGWGQSALLSLVGQFSSFTGSDLTTETLPTTGFVTSDGQDALNMAQPYASSMISSFLALGTATPAVTGTSGSTTTTVPAPSGIYTNNQPEPWNPAPC
jgi:LCP family protein required for cell wall assembly